MALIRSSLKLFGFGQIFCTPIWETITGFDEAPIASKKLLLTTRPESSSWCPNRRPSRRGNSSWPTTPAASQAPGSATVAARISKPVSAPAGNAAATGTDRADRAVPASARLVGDSAEPLGPAFVRGRAFLSSGRDPVRMLGQVRPDSDRRGISRTAPRRSRFRRPALRPGSPDRSGRSLDRRDGHRAPGRRGRCPGAHSAGSGAGDDLRRRHDRRDSAGLQPSRRQPGHRTARGPDRRRSDNAGGGLVRPAATPRRIERRTAVPEPRQRHPRGLQRRSALRFQRERTLVGPLLVAVQGQSDRQGAGGIARHGARLAVGAGERPPGCRHAG